MLFRGISKETGEWVYGYYVAANENTHWIVQMNCYGQLLSGLDKPKEVHPNSIAMNTGQVDKNKKPIFGSILIDGKMTKGGDIVKLKHGSGDKWHKKLAIVWDKKNCMFYARESWAETIGWTLDATEIEIIGTQSETE